MNRYIHKEDLIAGFRNAGILAGDTLFLHSDAMVTAQMETMPMEERLKIFLDALIEVIRPEGTLIVPTFTYSFCRNEVFDVRKTPCIPKDVGIFPEFFRNLPGVHRTLDPIFSVAVMGQCAETWLKTEFTDSFGPKSVFGLLHEKNAKIVCVGCSLDRATFIHYVEQCHGVPYRYPKSFSGKIIAHDGKTIECSVNYYVKDYEKNVLLDLDPLKTRLKEKGKMGIGTIGRVGVYAVSAADFFDEAALLLEENAYGLTKPQTISA